ncbi:vesicle-associated membrane protein-associated protein A isoform X2 [Prorops nasuta]|uniref:vesicle-associated membrane protein-associated protein A isoform X2 n=1 Tax=Prorops nasuta TaxID=863751 RepID=UPI0034CDE956
MAKPQQVLIIEPKKELRFRGPFTGSPVVSHIKLVNPTTYKVYYKIKTTAPKRYCVRPNSGYLMPKDVTEIAVSLQPYEFDPVEKDKHKFMVQTLIAPEKDDPEYPTDVWKDLSPDQFMNSKLKCVFENPLPATTTAKTTTNTTTTNSDSDITKNFGDTVKSSPKAHDDSEEKLIRAAHEVSQLRVEESNLRQENLQLREDLLKLKNAVSGVDSSLATAKGLSSQHFVSMTPTTSCLIAFAMVIVGFLLGKLI